MKTHRKKTQRLMTEFQEVGLRDYGRARFSTSTFKIFLAATLTSRSTTMSFRAKKRETRVEGRGKAGWNVEP